MNEDGAHLAPYIAESIKGDSVDTYAFSMFWYEAGNIGPFIEPLNPSVIYIAPVLVKSELIPVELLSFSSSVSNNTVTLNWRTATELNNLGFEIERILNDSWITIGFVKGNGTTTKISSYEFVDELSELYYEGILYYRLKQIDYVGTFEYSNFIEVEFSKNPTSFSVLQNFPNPFNPSTKIKFTISQFPLLGGDGRGGLVTLKVYDVLGKEVATLVNEELPAGEYEVDFSTVGGQESSIQNPASGIYFYQLRAGDFIQTKKMVFIK
jgi:hypothetical protein